jgi:hypothetical protein
MRRLRTHGAALSSLLEFLEPSRQSVPIGAILIPPRQLDHLSNDPFQTEFQERPVMEIEKSVRNVDTEIGVDPDQVNIEGRMVDFRQRQAIRDDRLPQLLVRIHDDMSSIE